MTRWYSTYVAADCRKCGAALGSATDARRMISCPECGSGKAPDPRAPSPSPTSPDPDALKGVYEDEHPVVDAASPAAKEK